MKYIVVCQQIVSRQFGFETIYGFDGKQFSSRDAAIKHGWKIRDSDDFNIGVLDGKKLVSFDWMDKPVDTEPAVLANISSQLYL